MEGIKYTYPGLISSKGDLQINMSKMKEEMQMHPNKQAIVTIEVLDGGEVVRMLILYHKDWLPRIVRAWRELGENYTDEQADFYLGQLTTTRQLWPGVIKPITDLDRNLLKKYMDEVSQFAAVNLSLIL